MTEPKTRCGYVLLIGRPNVGKSTLLNALLKKKISITSHKPQTTRHRILGILTEGSNQFIFVDTPGVQNNPKKHLNQAMNQQALGWLSEVDVVVFMADATQEHPEDALVLEKIQSTRKPIILILNKVDLLPQRAQVLPVIQQWASKADFREIVPISAKNQYNVEHFLQTVSNYLPSSEHFYLADQSTDKDLSFLLAEFLREQLVRQLGRELPYSTTVQLESLEKDQELYRVSALIWVERESQRPIVLGKGGERLKHMSTKARIQMERFLQAKVFLSVWVKVKDQWTEDPGVLKHLGFD